MKQGGTTGPGRRIAVAAVLFGAVSVASVWSAASVVGRQVGAGAVSEDARRLEQERTERLADEERAMLEHLGYGGDAPPAREPRRRRPRASRRDEELAEQLMMLGYTSGPPRPAAPAPARPAPRPSFWASLRLHPTAPSASPATDPPREARSDAPRRRPLPRGFAYTEDAPYTTFAADIDDASWVRTRGQIALGIRPSKASLRPEEFVNAMPYAYPDPQEGRLAVTTERVADADVPGWEIVRVGVQGRRMAEADRPPLDLTFLVDTSCSMAGARALPLFQEAVGPLLDHLGPQDTLSLWTFAAEPSRRLGATRADAEGALRFAEAVAGLHADGPTGMDVGLDLAYDDRRRQRPGAVSRVVLVSDGGANEGLVQGDALARMLRERHRDGLLLTVLGLGTSDAGDEVLEALSNQADGQYFALVDAHDARRVLGEQLAQTFVPLARDVKLQVEWDPEVVSAHRLVGYDNRAVDPEDFRQDEVDGGEVNVGHQVTALFVVRRVPGTGDRALGVLRIRSTGPERTSVATEEAFVLHGPRAADPMQASPDTVVALAAASLAARLKRERLLPLEHLVDPLSRAIDPVHRDHRALLEAVRAQVAPELLRPPPGRSGVVSLQVDPLAFEELRVRCGDWVGQGRFEGGRAVVAGLPDGACVADLRGGRPTVSLGVEEGRSYRCDGQPLRCRTVE